MSVRALHAELRAVRALMSDGLAEVRAGSDPGQFWVRTACARLTAADDALVEAAGVLPAAVRLGVATLVTFAAATLTATAAGAAGLGGTGVVVTTGLVLLMLLGVTPWAGRRVRRAVGRRRLAEIHAPSPPQARAEPVLVGLAGVPEILVRARVRLVSATLRQTGSGHWSVPELRQTARADPVVRRLAAADLLLCQAVDCLERYFDDLAKGWP